ncbi:MAG TPA: NlpC/P60 family protein [Gaiellaceae bacterium]|nr:NlpC/P60 family protein [Gaiellaceae bacterium]
MRRRAIVLVAVLALVAICAEAASARPSPEIRRQRAHERAVMHRIATIGRHLERVVQDYDGAKLRLARVERNLELNEYALHVAKRNLRSAQTRLMERIRSLYVDGEPSTLDVLAGASSISQILDRLESAQMLSRQDAALGAETFRFTGTVRKREVLLRAQKRERAKTVRRLAARKRTIEGALAEQRRLLASIHTTIRKIQEREAARAREQRRLAQLRLQREIAAQQAASRGAAFSGLVPSPVTGSGAGHPEAAQIALRYLGIPYVWGGASTGGFDCSGLVMYVYAQLGISLPHYTVSQWNATIPVSYSDMQPGDLVFFDGLGHVGIYIGGGRFVDAPHTGSVVRIDSIAGFGGFDGARRVP